MKTCLCNFIFWIAISCSTVLSRGLHGPDYLGPCPVRPAWLQSGLGPARKMNWNFCPRSARLSPKRYAKLWPGSGPKQNDTQCFGPDPARSRFFRFWLGPLVFSDFKTGPFSCFHLIKDFFYWWFIFLQFIKTSDFVLTAFR